jgi:hypothetical protein
MSHPISLDIPHKLGLAEARRRLDGGVGKIADYVPGGGNVVHHWEGDTLHFTITAMGQSIACRVGVFEDKVHADIDLPPFLSLFAGKIRGAFGKALPKLLK